MRSRAGRSQLSIPHRTKQKLIKENETKTRYAQYMKSVLVDDLVQPLLNYCFMIK